MEGIIKFLKEKKPEIDLIIKKYLPEKFDKKSLEFIFGKPSYAYNIEALNKSLAEPIWDFLNRGGKRWRPALFLLITEALGGNVEKVKDFVILLELLHTGCLSGDTFVLKNPGEQVKISEIKSGDIVYTLNPNGKLEKNKVLACKFNGIRDVYKVQTRNREIKATDNHPFLVVTKHQPIRCKITEIGREKLNRKLKWGDINKVSKRLKRSVRILYNSLDPKQGQLLEKHELESVFNFFGLNLEREDYIEKQTKFEAPVIKFVWRQLKNLKVGNAVVVLRKVYDNGMSYKLPVPARNPPKDKTIIPDYTTKEFCQLFGYLLGDGSITINKKSSRLYICPSNNEDEKRAYTTIFSKLFNYNLKSEREGNYERLYCCSYKVCWLLKELGLHKKATEKTIPGWVFTLPIEQKLAFVKGYLDSDGWVRLEGSTVFSSSSKMLITQLKLLLDSLGFAVSQVSHRKIRNLWKNSVKKESDQWYIILSAPNDVLERIGTEKNIYKKRLVKQRRKFTFKFSRLFPTVPLDLDKFRLDRIKKIEFCSREPVYDLMIENSHNFIANNMIVHNSIIVDDVEDNADLRRGKPAMHKIFGVDIAINAGNFMYFLPFLALIKNKDRFDSKILIRAYGACLQELIRIHAGQGSDIVWHKGLANADNITENEYLQMCSYKTGVLPRLAARLAVIFANGNKELEDKLGKFGESLGIAFQLKDDILNLQPTEKWGKEFGEDIAEGKRTLIVICTLKKASEEDRKRLIEILRMHTKDKKLIEEAIQIIKKYKAIQYAEEFAEKMIKQAWEQADKLLKESEAKEKLKEFVNFAVEREI